MTDQTHPWRQFVAEAEARLRRAGSPSPEIDARRIVEEASGYEAGEYHRGLDQPATARGMAHFDAMLVRRVQGEPLQYVLGRWAFRDLDLLVDSRVLIPRPETEIVAGVAIEELQRHDGPVQVVDLGTGSGAIGLSVAHEVPKAQVVLADVSDDALAVARANLAGLGRAGARVAIRQGSWFEALDAESLGTFHLVVSNPPYVDLEEELPDEVRLWEPELALRAQNNGTSDLRVLIAGARHWLAPGGSLVLEMAPHQTDPMAELAAELGYDDVDVIQDLVGRNRAVRGRWRA